MACEVVFTQSAEADRDHVVEYLLDIVGQPVAAAHFLDELDALVDRLAEHPLMYEKASEERLAARGYRKAPLQNHIAVYCTYDDTVEITRIFHQKQDHARML